MRILLDIITPKLADTVLLDCVTKIRSCKRSAAQHAQYDPYMHGAADSQVFHCRYDQLQVVADGCGGPARVPVDASGQVAISAAFCA